MLEIVRSFAVADKSNWFDHITSDSRDVDQAEPASNLLTNDDSTDEQVANRPLPEFVVRKGDDTECSILILDLHRIEEIRNRLVLIVVPNGTKSRALNEEVLRLKNETSSGVDTLLEGRFVRIQLHLHVLSGVSAVAAVGSCRLANYGISSGEGWDLGLVGGIHRGSVVCSTSWLVRVGEHVLQEINTTRSY